MEGHLAVSSSTEWETSETLNTRLGPFASIFASEGAKQAIAKSLKKYNAQCEWKHTSTPFSIAFSSNCVDVCRAMFDSFLSVDLDVPNGGKGITPEIAANFDQKCAEWLSETRNAFHIALSADNAKVTIRTHAGNMPVLEIWRNTVRHYLRGLLFQTKTLFESNRGDASSQSMAAKEANAIHGVGMLAFTECSITKLADDDLAAIFKHLPPYERLIVSEVCQKWRDLSNTPWRDVTYLDLSQVPTQNIHAVLKKCPSLISVAALRQNLGDLGRFFSRLDNVVALECVGCAFTIEDTVASFHAASARLRATPLSEFIWHGVGLYVLPRDARVRQLRWPLVLPTALKRLQMSGWVPRVFLDFRLNQSPQLESVIVSFQNLPDEDDPPFMNYLCAANLPTPHRLETLREVYLGLVSPHLLQYEDLAFSLPQLQLLFVDNGDFGRAVLRRLLLEHPSLRVAVLTASFVPRFAGEHVIPTRKLYPNGFNARPVPPLHLFLGKIAAARLRFEPSPANALKIYPIDAPLPEFLEKEEVKPIFEGSWIASRIKEGVEEGIDLTDYSFEGPTTSILYAQ